MGTEARGPGASEAKLERGWEEGTAAGSAQTVPPLPNPLLSRDMAHRRLHALDILLGPTHRDRVVGGNLDS